MRSTLKAVVIAGALLCAPATAAAAERPVVTTGNATSIAPTTVVLNGFVTPKGATTTYTDFIPYRWARRWPAEQLWCVTRRR